MKTNIRQQKGFSFVELLVAIAILGILTAITMVSFQGANKNARDTRRKAEIHEMKGAIEEYRLVNETYPAVNDTSVDGIFLSTLQPDFLTKNYLDPKNSATNYYSYQYVGNSGCQYALIAIMENSQNAQSCPAACALSGTDWYCLSE